MPYGVDAISPYAAMYGQNPNAPSGMYNPNPGQAFGPQMSAADYLGPKGTATKTVNSQAEAEELKLRGWTQQKAIPLPDNKWQYVLSKDNEYTAAGINQGILNAMISGRSPASIAQQEAINRQYDYSASTMRSNLLNRGLYNSTVYNSMMRGNEAERAYQQNQAIASTYPSLDDIGARALALYETL